MLRAIDYQQRAATGFVAQFDVHHAIGIFVGIGIEEDTVDNAEDHSGRANSEGEGEHSGENESR